jgi:hypothetical protein
MVKQLKNPERSFGVSVGAVLLLMAVILWWRGRVARAEILAGIGGILVCFGVVWPRALGPLSRAWWKLAAILGYVNARVWLSLLFVLLLVPMSVIWRLIGTDPLSRRRTTFRGWTPYPARYRDRTHFERMF